MEAQASLVLHMLVAAVVVLVPLVLMLHQE